MQRFRGRGGYLIGQSQSREPRNEALTSFWEIANEYNYKAMFCI